MSDPLENHNDIVAPFIFENLPVRGALIQMKRSWARMQLGHAYDDLLTEVLGQASAATALIAQSLKFDGSITLQISGDGPLSILVMQCTDQLELRGMADAHGDTGQMTYAELTRGCRCAVTVDAGRKQQPYQGIVEILGDRLAESFENYFARSVQIATHMVLVADRSVCGGILLQQMPDRGLPVADDWQRLGLLARTLAPRDLDPGIGAALVGHLFAEDDVRVFEQQPVVFRCRCSRERAEEVLKLLGAEETRAALAERGRVDVTCEYCGMQQAFDAVDVTSLFAEQLMDAPADTVH